VLLALGILFLGLVGSAQHTYALYYDRSGGGDLEINFLNTSPTPATIALGVYDAWGRVLHEESVQLRPFDAAYRRLGESIAWEDTNWGLIRVESARLLALGLEYFDADGELTTVDTIAQALPASAPDVRFQLVGYYNQTSDAATGVTLINPWDTAVTCSAKIYDADGKLLYEEELTIDPYNAEYGPFEELIGTSSYHFGLVEVESVGYPIVMALEHYGRGWSGLEIDNIMPLITVAPPPAPSPEAPPEVPPEVPPSAPSKGKGS
jgi:hypothetical protein